MKIWTVGELINELRNYPEDWDIEVNSFEGAAPMYDITAQEEKKVILINPYM